MKNFLIAIICLMIQIHSFSQTNIKFDWMSSQNFTTTSSKTVDECSELEVKLITPNGHKKYVGNIYSNTAATQAGNGPNIYQVKIEFSSPVSNVRLRVSDIDRKPRNNNSIVVSGTTEHGEKLINFSPSTPTATGGLITVGNEVHAKADDSAGWLTWNGSNMTSISFDVKRYTNKYGVLIEEVEFDCNNYELPICCPPMDTSLLKDLFTHVPTGSIMDPYKLKFNNNQFFKNLFQAYIDFVNIAHPGANRLVSHWRLIDAGTGTLANNVYSPKIEETYSWFEPGQGGNLFGDTNFFNAKINHGQWVKIHTGIYTEPSPNVIGDCRYQNYFFYRVQVMKGRLVGEFSGGRRTLKRIDLGKSIASKRR